MQETSNRLKRMLCKVFDKETEANPWTRGLRNITNDSKQNGF